MKKFILIVSLFLIFTLTGCTMFMPSYSVNYSDETGSTINVSGVTYKDANNTVWRPSFDNDDVLIGTIKTLDGGNSGIQVYLSRADEKKVFVITKVPYFIIDNGIAFNYYSRDDVDLPSFDRKGVDALCILDYTNKKYKKVINDPQIMNRLWDILETTEIHVPLNVKNRYTLAYCDFMNSKLMGIGVETNIIAYGDNYYISYKNSYITLPQDLLEQIAGQKLPTPSEYIASKQKKAG